MKLSVFDTLETVLRAGSLARAAAQLNLTPSAVSMQMKQLETYFGQPLFDRTDRQVRATPFAREVSALMSPSLQRLAALRGRTTVAVEGTVRLGVIETLQTGLLPDAMRFLRDRYPALRVRPVRGRSVELIEAVRGGGIDAAVVSQPGAGGPKRLDWTPLARSELVVVAPPESTETRIWALFKAYEWIRFDPNTNIGREAARYLRRHAPEAHGSVEMQSVLGVVAMVSAGLGVSLVALPDRRLTQAYPVRALPLARGAPYMQISLVTRGDGAGGRRLDAVREAIESVLARAGA